MHFPPDAIIKVGDRAVFVPYVDFTPEHHITKGKAYDGIIIKSLYGRTEIEITNDIGEKTIQEALYGRLSGGATTIITQVDGEPMRERKLAFVDKLIAEAEETHIAILARLQTKRNILLQEG